MLPTLYIHRVLIVCPAARRAAFNTWAHSALDPTGGDWLTTGLSATGNAPALAYAANAALAPAQLKLLMQRLCTQASIAPPAAWDGWDRGQRKQWMTDQRDAIRSATGIRVRVFDNDSVWDDPAAELAAAGLRTIAT